jgi:hypothetical protein
MKFLAIREEMNSSTGRVLVVVVEASDLSSTKQDQGNHLVLTFFSKLTFIKDVKLLRE